MAKLRFQRPTYDLEFPQNSRLSAVNSQMPPRPKVCVVERRKKRPFVVRAANDYFVRSADLYPKRNESPVPAQRARCCQCNVTVTVSSLGWSRLYLSTHVALVRCNRPIPPVNASGIKRPKIRQVYFLVSTHLLPTVLLEMRQSRQAHGALQHRQHANHAVQPLLFRRSSIRFQGRQAPTT